MKIALAIAAIYLIYLLNRWLDRRAAERFVTKICGKQIQK